MKRIEPAYPAQALVDRIEGDVRLQVTVAADGAVQDVGLISGPPQLAPAAVAAVRQWKYEPMLVSGRPVPVRTTVDIPFRLPGAAR